MNPKVNHLLCYVLFFLPQGETLTPPPHQIQWKLIKKSDEEILKNFVEILMNFIKTYEPYR